MRHRPTDLDAGRQEGYAVNFAKASEICGAWGYNILERSSDEGIGRDLNGKLVSTQTRVMMIQCRQ